VRRPRYFSSFSEWDTDGDQKVDPAELEAALGRKGITRGWDDNGDGRLTRIEYATGLYWAWDLNRDGAVDPAEYRNGAGAYFPSQDTFGAFDDYDVDDDRKLKLSEFSALSNKVYAAWERNGDGDLTDSEVQTALYSAWDADDDGVVDRREYRWD
jgi:hypothetical protein